MAFSDTQKVDLLFKKLAFGVAKTDVAANKSPSNEAISSPLPVYGNRIWTQAEDIPLTPPGATTTVVEVRTGVARVRLKVDPSVTTNAAWVAVANHGDPITDANRLGDWIPFSIGSLYAVKVFVGGTAPGNQIFPDAAGKEWYFDYQAGVLNFVEPSSGLPTGVNAGATLYVEGYRYIGVKGVGAAAGISSKNWMVANIAARDDLLVAAGDTVYVTDAGNGEWASFLAITAGTDATYVQLVDQDASNVDSRTYTTVITPASAATTLLGGLSPQRRPFSVAVDVTDDFDGTPTLTVGDAAVADRLMEADENDLAVPFVYMVNPAYQYPTNTDVNVYFTAGGATGGSATVTLTYA